MPITKTAKTSPVLLVFPEHPNTKSGFGFAVSRDLRALRAWFGKGFEVFYTALTEHVSDIVIPRRSTRDIKRLFAFACSPYPSACLSARALSRVIRAAIRDDVAFCGDSTLYPAVRALLPRATLFVRFHNVHADTFHRFLKLGLWKAAPLYCFELWRHSLLERRIARDPLAVPVFITKQDADFCRTRFRPHRSYVKLLWPQRCIRPKEDSIRRLVWFGAASRHKAVAIDYFLRSTWPKIRAEIPALKLSLYGRGTERFAGPGVQGYGIFTGDGFPHADGAMYINPDVVGGGVKVKIIHYIENGIPFISTPLGCQGISVPLARMWVVAELEDWAACLKSFCDRAVMHDCS